MNILIVGSGCSAVYLASLISFYKKEIRVDILSNDDVIGKKILVTGNGRCNLGNLGNIGINEYNSQKWGTYKIINKGDDKNAFSKF